MVGTILHNSRAILLQAKAIISHKALALVAVQAAKLAGIDRSHVYTMASAPEVNVDLVSIEYVHYFYTPTVRAPD